MRRSAEAMAMTNRLSREFGLLVGTSSGANVAAALRIRTRVGTRGQRGDDIVRSG